MSETATLASLRAARVLSSSDEHFARVLCATYQVSDPGVLLAASLVSRALAHGHVCLDIAGLGGTAQLVAEDGSVWDSLLPETGEWLDKLAISPLCAGDAPTPLLLDGTRLYSRRYWRYENDLATALSARCAPLQPALGGVDLGALLDRYFGRREHREGAALATDWQRVAALVAVHRKLCVISGGPGTGKTHTVANLLAVLAEDDRLRLGRLPEVLLMAPTGKAANRLGAALARTAETVDAEIAEVLRAPAMTIHRALGRRPRSRTRFRHDADDPLRADIVVVDEASMVDLALMSRLVDAVPPHARLVLLGDRDQLASVEAGAILADVCGDSPDIGYRKELASAIAAVDGAQLAVASAETPPICDSIVPLRHNYRYGEDSGIGRLAEAINRADAQEVIRILRAAEDTSVCLLPPLGEGAGDLLARCRRHFAGLFSGTAQDRLAALGRFRVLSPLRRGPFGVAALGRQIEAEVRASTSGSVPLDSEDAYPGRPVMVVRNDAESGLFNGDVGVLIEAAAGGLRAAFDIGGGVRELSLSRLPAYEVVYATTVHKSQGSEFDEVAIVLPDRASPLLTRELLYTAVTRARSRAVIYASEEMVAAAVERRVVRASGLRERLWSTAS